MNEEEKQQSKGGLIFDIVFELILCFAVLIVAMLLSQGDVIGGPYYSVNFVKCAVGAAFVVFLLVFITKKSTKSMDESMKALKEEGFLGGDDL